jgi:hypothetical protein
MSRSRRCLCCRRKARVNEHGLCPECAVCLHCEERPSVHALGLCEDCHATPGIRSLYVRRRNWTPEWELHLRRKTAEVQRALKLEKLKKIEARTLGPRPLNHRPPSIA